MLGKKVRCKGCGHVFQVSEDGGAEDPSDLGSLAAAAESMSGRTGTHIGHTAGSYGGNAEANPEDALAAARSQLSRSNEQYRYSGAETVDAGLPWGLLLGGILLMVLLGGGEDLPGWFAPLRAAVFMILLLAVVHPLTMVGVRKAAVKCNFDLPERSRTRVLAALMVPATFSFILWNIGEGLASFIIGCIVGLGIGMAVLFLLLRLKTREAPTTLGLASAFFTAGVVIAVALVSGFNMILANAIAKDTATQFAQSPLGPGLDWPEKPEAHRKKKDGTPAFEVSTDIIAPVASKKTGAASEDTAATDADPVDEAKSVDPTNAVATKGPGGSNPNIPDDVEKLIEENKKKAPESGTTKKKAAPENELSDTKLYGQRIGHPTLVTDIQDFSRTMVALSAASRFGIVTSTGDLEVYDCKVPLSLWGKSTVTTNDAVAISPDGEKLAELAGYTLSIRSVQTGKVEKTMPSMKAEDGEAELVGFSGSKRVIVLRGKNGKYAVQIFDALRGGKPSDFMLPGFSGSPAGIATSTDGDFVVSTVEDQFGNPVVRVSNIAAGRKVQDLAIMGLDKRDALAPNGLAFSTNGKLIACYHELTSAGEASVQVWNRNGQQVFNQSFGPGKLAPLSKQFRGNPVRWVNNDTMLLINGRSLLDAQDGRVIGDTTVAGAVNAIPLDADTVVCETVAGNSRSPKSRIVTVDLQIQAAEAAPVGKRAGS